jgi:hypothetical protein
MAESRPGSARPRLTPTGNTKDDESGVPRLQRRRSESHPLERAGHERFHQDVELRQNAKEQIAPAVRLEIEGDESLVTGVHLPPERQPVCRPLPERIAGPGLLHLDDVGAEVGEQHAGDTSGDHPRQVKDSHAVKRLHALVCSGHNGKTSAMVYLFCQ